MTFLSARAMHTMQPHWLVWGSSTPWTSWFARPLSKNGSCPFSRNGGRIRSRCISHIRPADDIAPRSGCLRIGQLHCSRLRELADNHQPIAGATTPISLNATFIAIGVPRRLREPGVPLFSVHRVTVGDRALAWDSGNFSITWGDPSGRRVAFDWIIG